MGVSIFLVRNRKLAGLEFGDCVLNGRNFFDGLVSGFFSLVGGRDFVYYMCGGSVWLWGWVGGRGGRWGGGGGL